MNNLVKIQDNIINLNDITMFEQTRGDREELNDNKDIYLTIHLHKDKLHIFCEDEVEYNHCKDFLLKAFEKINVKIISVRGRYFNSNKISYITIENDVNYALSIGLIDRIFIDGMNDFILPTYVNNSEEADDILNNIMEG